MIQSPPPLADTTCPTLIKESESWRRFLHFAVHFQFWFIRMACRPNRNPGIFRQKQQSSLQTSKNAGWRRKSAHNCGSGASLMKSITWREAILGGFCWPGTDGLLANIKTLIILHKRPCIVHNVSICVYSKPTARGGLKD